LFLFFKKEILRLPRLRYGGASMSQLCALARASLVCYAKLMSETAFRSEIKTCDAALLLRATLALRLIHPWA
jgi:hypothetical protein